MLVFQCEVSEFFLLVALKFYFSFSSQVNPCPVNTSFKKSFHHVLYHIEAFIAGISSPPEQMWIKLFTAKLIPVQIQNDKGTNEDL